MRPTLGFVRVPDGKRVFLYIEGLPVVKRFDTPPADFHGIRRVFINWSAAANDSGVPISINVPE